MDERDIRYTSWVISITSIVYAIAYLYRTYAIHEQGVANRGLYYYIYYVLFVSLIIAGIVKISGLIVNNKEIKRWAIVSLMFIWGFIWTSNIIECLMYQFDDKSITLFPIVAICAYIAFRGDYH